MEAIRRNLVTSESQKIVKQKALEEAGRDSYGKLSWGDSQVQFYLHLSPSTCSCRETKS